MTTRGKLVGWVLLGLLGAMLVEGCGSSSTRNKKPPAPAAGTAGKDMGTVTVEPQGGQGGNGGLSPYDEHCGITVQSCVPDESTNELCKPSIGGGPTGLPGAGRGASGGTELSNAGQGGESAASGVGTTPSQPSGGGEGGAPGGGEGGDAPSLAGAAGAVGENGGNEAAGGEAGGVVAPIVAGRSAQAGSAGTVSGVAGTAGITASTLSLTSCQVTEDSKHKGRAVAQCLPAGNGQEGDPCFSGADCRAALACVGDGPGQCRPYCCSGNGACRDRTNCSAEPLVQPSSKTKLEVPVCMPVVNCSLAEPPCEAGATCSCPVESACVVVGSDGTTSCVKTASLPPEGKGEEGMACPCAWGFVCSQASHACVKLCPLAAADLYCGGARCQASTALPNGWGTCVGVPPRSAR